MPHPHKNQEILNSNEPSVKDDRGITHVSREQIYPLVSNNYKRSETKEQKEN